MPLRSAVVTGGTINPPTLTDAYWYRDFSDPADPSGDTVIVGLHSVRGGHGPGNAFADRVAGGDEPQIHIRPGDPILLEDASFVVTAVEVQGKQATAEDARIWADGAHDLVVLTCLIDPGSRSPPSRTWWCSPRGAEGLGAAGQIAVAVMLDEPERPVQPSASSLPASTCRARYRAPRGALGHQCARHGPPEPAPRRSGRTAMSVRTAHRPLTATLPTASSPIRRYEAGAPPISSSLPGSCSATATHARSGASVRIASDASGPPEPPAPAPASPG
ncbi:hypothetical protein G7085_16320 [Tessaracoccus sp. HDW20]|uniref:hypothetical protein n=1 Tax=Tessaracoccus coleopterorum TaxID=2714950 RepID=UPI0018D3EDFB|nr:hypothetical protein [Tessaracoccus coleopterorum]NHB85627.1 hypothetical protein [Tessaracoccus coleopterorum]